MPIHSPNEVEKHFHSEATREGYGWGKDMFCWIFVHPQIYGYRWLKEICLWTICVGYIFDTDGQYTDGARCLVIKATQTPKLSRIFRFDFCCFDARHVFISIENKSLGGHL